MSYGFTDEQLAAARSANLAEYFQKSGYDCELRRNELHVKGFGGFYINADTNEWYCFSKSGKNGGRNAVNCLVEMLGMDWKTAVSELLGCSPVRSAVYDQHTSPPRVKRELSLPDRADTMMDMCLAVAKGEKFLGRKTERGQVVYMALEDTLRSRGQQSRRSGGI